jgi:hypothetical protein
VGRQASVQVQQYITTLGIARLVARVAENDGKVNDDDRDHLNDIMKRQQGVWNVLLLMDTLVRACASTARALSSSRDAALDSACPCTQNLATLMPTLTSDVLEGRSANGWAWSNATQRHELDDTRTAQENDLLWWYVSVAAITFFPTAMHLMIMMVMQLYMMTSYLSEVLDIIWFFINYRKCLTTLNFAILPLTTCTTITCVLGAMLAYGVGKGVLPLLLCVAV